MTGEVWDFLFAINVKGKGHVPLCEGSRTTYEKTIRWCNRQPWKRSGSEQYWFFHSLCSH